MIISKVVLSNYTPKITDLHVYTEKRGKKNIKIELLTHFTSKKFQKKLIQSHFAK